MSKHTTTDQVASIPVWENLEEWVRTQIQTFVQELLEEEIIELLGRRKSARRAAVDGATGYRNGYGKPRHLTLRSGTITVRRPRVRGLEARFASVVLPLFARRTQAVSALLPELYLHGLAHRDFDLALRGLLGETAPLSASTVARLKEKWQAEWERWMSRRLDALEVTYLWVDGVYVKAGLEKEKAALLVVLAGRSDGRKEFLALVPGHRESTEAWSAVLRELKARGMCCPKVVIGDGHLGIWGALRNIYPEAAEQRCWNHRVLNVLEKLPKKHQGQARALLLAIPYAPTREDAERRKAEFQRWCQRRDCVGAARLLDQDWERMVTFYRFPQEHWAHLRTTNPLESPFAALRLRTDAAKRFKSVTNATAVMWKMLMIAEHRFRRLNAPELVREVYLGVKFVNGRRGNAENQEVAA